MRNSTYNPGESGYSYSKHGLSLSPKVGSQGSLKPAHLAFNSPKNESGKGIIFSPHAQNLASKPSYRNEKYDGDATPKNSTLTNITSNVNGSPKIGIKPKPISDKSVPLIRPAMEAFTQNPKPQVAAKISESLNLKELLRRDKPKKLEITTDFSGTKSNISNGMITTKHKDLSEIHGGDSAKNNMANHYSFEFTNKFSKGIKPKPIVEDLSKTRSTGMLNRYNITQEKNTLSPKKFDKPRAPVGISLESTMKRGEKNRTHMTNESNDDSKITEMSKKSYTQTQLDLRQALRGISTEDPKHEQSMKKQSTKSEQEPPTQKVSLQAFVTKVNKGDLVGLSSKIADRGEDTTPTRKPYLLLEEKNKTPKSNHNNQSHTPSNLFSKGTKTSTNADSKAFVFNNNKLIPQQNETEKKTRSVKPTTPSDRGRDDLSDTTMATTNGERKPFVYYMTNMDKYHRNHGMVDYFTQIYREHFIQTYQAMMFCRYLKPVEAKVLAQKRVFLSKRESHKDKKTLVFDLDETLIHCNESLELPYDVKLPIKFPHGEIIEAGINIRPFAVDCLRELSQLFEIIVFTASHGCYANVVLDYLDPKNQYIHHRLFRESCVVTDEGIYVKDLRVLANRNLQDVVIVDNAAYSFGYQIENGIPIVPFYDNKSDQELRYLTPYLKFLSGVKDLREINKQTFKLNLYHNYDSPEKALERIILSNK